MKKRIYSKTAIALSAVIFLTSCADLFDKNDIKNNPNAPLDAPLPIVMSGGEVMLAQAHEDTDTRIAYMWGGQLAGLSRQHAGFQIYSVSAGTFDNGWFIPYVAGAQARIVQKKATAQSNNVALGIGKMMEALVMAKLTSLYGDVPYTEAWDEVKFPSPKYDTQANVYAALIALCTSAYNDLTATPTGTGDGDFIYGGDPLKWAAAAKTLQARLYLHLKDYPNALASAALGISSTAGDALIPHGTAQTIDNNLNYDFFENSRPGDTGFDPPAFLPTFMRTRIDGGPANTSSTAVRNAKTDETGLFNHFFKYGIYGAPTSLDPNTRGGMFDGDAPHPILTYYENQLIIAEANARIGGANLAAAVTALNNVRAGLDGGYINGKTFASAGTQYTPYVITDFDPAGVANGGAGPVTGRNQQQALIYEILSQKFEVMLAQYEVFNDMRRTQVATPIVKLPIPSNDPTGAGRIPGRFLYPQNEVNTNPTNTPSVANVYVKVPIWQ